MKKLDIESLAGRLYDTYCLSVGGLAFNGDPLPKWDAFREDPAKRKQSEAWIHSAAEAMRISHAENCVPGLWMCPTCNFRMHKRIIGRHDVGVDTSAHTDPCPNDGDAMLPVTWEDYSQGQELLLAQKQEEINALRKQKSHPRITREFHEFIKEYIDGYEMRDQDHGDYTPNANEKAVAEDAIHGLLDDDEFLSFVIQFRIGPSIEAGINAIVAERTKQFNVKGWTAEHDDAHIFGALARAATCYVETAAVQSERSLTELPACYIHKNWPWERDSWKVSNDPVRNLEKAGALIAAEIDRLKRKETTGS
jgi:hypothetical protein